MIKGQYGKRRGIAILAMWMLVMAVPVSGQEVILGFVDGFDGDCNGPGTACNAGSGFVGVFGWASATTGVKRVEILIESVEFPGNVTNLGRALTGQPRDGGLGDVGWVYNINSTLFGNGQYDVWARVVTYGGSIAELAPKQVLFTNNPTVLRPFGEIDRPGQNEDLYGTCDRGFCGDGVCEIGLGENCRNCPVDCNGREFGLFDDFCCGYNVSRNPRDCDDPDPSGDPDVAICQQGGFVCSEERRTRYTVVRGYALDLGISDEDAGIAWVELETNGALVGNTRTNCVFDRQQGGLTNCYGLPRVDLESRYPYAFDAPSAGYRFVLDVGFMLEYDLVTLGSNELIVRAGDWADQFEDIDRVSVNFFCAEDVPEPSFGEVESPRPGRLYSGLLNFEGWALDGEGIDRIELFVDGIPVENLVPGVVTEYGPGLGTRPHVAADYPGFPDTERPVWRLVGFDTSTLDNGFHSFLVRAVDDDGDNTFIGGEVIFRTDNSLAGTAGLYKPLAVQP